MELRQIVVGMFCGIFLLYLPAVHGDVKKNCRASVETLNQVKSCPATEKEWMKHAEKMNCTNINQNCTERKLFKYHCVNKENGMGFLEVCAVETEIIGNACTQFNIGGEIIQPDYSIGCEENCPWKYKSTDYYKHPKCMSRKVHERNGNDTEYILTAAVVFLSISQLVTCGVLVFVIKRKDRRDERDQQRADPPSDETVPESQTVQQRRAEFEKLIQANKQENYPAAKKDDSPSRMLKPNSTNQLDGNEDVAEDEL